MSRITSGMSITAGPAEGSLRPHQRVELWFGSYREMVTIANVRPLGGGKYSVIFTTDEADTFRMEYNPSTGTGSVK